MQMDFCLWMLSDSGYWDMKGLTLEESFTEVAEDADSWIASSDISLGFFTVCGEDRKIYFLDAS
jgi:hypothetical protein